MTEPGEQLPRALIRGISDPGPDSDPSAWIVRARPKRNELNPFEPYGFFLEKERSGSGRIVDGAGILLTNKECPWHCLMCDLWKNTLRSRVPPGAIPAQIKYALERLETRPEQIKLYNSGSFFDPGAIPVEDYGAIATSVAFAKHVIVECHPRLVGPRALLLRELLAGSLEVAMGLETVHPEVLPRLNKRFTLDHFADTVELLRKQRISVRAFILVKPPFIREDEAVDWAVESARFAFSCGADVVSLIPTRAGNGAMDALAALGEFSPPKLETLESSQEAVLALEMGRVFADTWDLSAFSTCSHCLDQRRERLEGINLGQAVRARVHCESCGAGRGLLT